MPLTLSEFYKGKAKPATSLLFGYNEQGELTKKDKMGTITDVLTLPTYRKTTTEEIDEMQKTRLSAIQTAMEEYDRVRMELHQEYQKKDQKDRNRVHELNRAVEQADLHLQQVRFPIRHVNIVDSISIRRIDFTQPREDRKAYDVVFMEASPFKLQDFYVRVGAPATKPLISVAQAKKEENVILFGSASDLDYGMFSLNWEVEIELTSSIDGKSTMYHSAIQAILAEMAKSFQDQTSVDRIMSAMTPESIQYSVENVPGDRDANEVRWKTQYEKLLYDVNLSKFTQYPALATHLLQTGTARLGAYEPKDNQISIGLSLDDSRSKNPAFWTGQNLFGVTLMKVRDYLRSQQEQLAQVAQASQVGTTSVKKKIRRPKVGDKPAEPSATEPALQPSDVTAPPVPVSIQMNVAQNMQMAQAPMVQEQDIPLQFQRTIRRKP